MGQRQRHPKGAPAADATAKERPAEPGNTQFKRPPISLREYVNAIGTLAAVMAFYTTLTWGAYHISIWLNRHHRRHLRLPRLRGAATELLAIASTAAEPAHTDSQHRGGTCSYRGRVASWR